MEKSPIILPNFKIRSLYFFTNRPTGLLKFFFIKILKTFKKIDKVLFKIIYLNII